MIDHDVMHPVFRELLAAPADSDAPAIEDRSLEDLREEFANDMAAVDKEAPEIESVEDTEIQGPAGIIPVRVYVGAAPRPRTDGDRGLRATPTILFIHGGGFFRGSIDTHDSICRVLAAETGGTVVSPEYRLPPEDVFPAAVDDCYAALRWVAQYSDNIIVAGDSAGATLAAALTIKARDENGPGIARQILYYPTVDHATPDAWESNTLFSKGYWLDTAPYCIELYLPDVSSRTNPLASPLLADSHAGLPPAYICTAGFDPLRDQGAAYAEKLREAGVDVTYENLDNMLHGFVSCRGLVDAADDVIKRSVAEYAVE
jgi:acetyl esterase